MLKLQLRHYRVVYAVRERGSVLAAQALGLTQSALSAESILREAARLEGFLAATQDEMPGEIVRIGT